MKGNINSYDWINEIHHSIAFSSDQKMMLFFQLRMMEAVNPWMYWAQLLLAVGLAKLWEQLGFIIWGESMAISGANFIIIAIRLGILREIRVLSAVIVHWSEGHEEMTESRMP